MGKQKARKLERQKRSIGKQPYQRLLQRCRELPPTNVFVIKDFITNLFVTVLDLRLETTTVLRALEYYQVNSASAVSTFDDLKRLLESGMADSYIARQLWGYGYGNRIVMLRALVRFFDSIGVTTQSALEAWASSADFERDFKGRIPNLAYAAFKWLVMRVGVDTIKPDVHVLAFVEVALGFRLSDTEAVAILEKVARDLGIRAAQLDATIWTYQRALASTIVFKNRPS
jgi:hypothetical protein